MLASQRSRVGDHIPRCAEDGLGAKPGPEGGIERAVVFDSPAKCARDDTAGAIHTQSIARPGTTSCSSS
jgi:hypothetical protein